MANAALDQPRSAPAGVPFRKAQEHSGTGLSTQDGRVASPPLHRLRKDDTRGAPSAAVDNRPRSIAKAISYRTAGTLYTIVISQLVTGEIRWAISIGLLDFFSKAFLFYAHERLWMRIPFGRQPGRPEYEV